MLHERYYKKKIIGGNFLKNVYDKVTNAISTGSKILKRTGEIKKIALPLLKKVMNSNKQKEILPTTQSKLNDRSRAILSNLIAGSGFKNYMS